MALALEKLLHFKLNETKLNETRKFCLGDDNNYLTSHKLNYFGFLLYI